MSEHEDRYSATIEEFFEDMRRIVAPQEDYVAALHDLIEQAGIEIDAITASQNRAKQQNRGK